MKRNIKIKIIILTLLLISLHPLVNISAEESQNTVYDVEYSDELVPMDVDSDDATEGFSELMSIPVGEDNEVACLIEEECNEASELRRYDAREDGIVTPVKNQGSYGSCWTFAVMSEAETSVLKQGMQEEKPDGSEFHLAHFAYVTNLNKLAGIEPTFSTNNRNSVSAGGNDFYAISRLMNWQGVALEKDYPYSLANSNKEFSKEESDVHNYIVSDFYLIPTKNTDKAETAKILKACIKKFGSIGWSYYSDSTYYNKLNDENGNRTAAYSTISANNIPNKTNHAIAIIGWDDDFPVEKFNSSNRPSKPGAWIAKNSYGPNSSLGGFFYISYEEPTLGISNPASVVLVKNDVSGYDNNYFNSNGIIKESRVHTISVSGNGIANVYTASGKEDVERLSAVSFLTYSANDDYSIQIYRNPQKDANGNVTNPATGKALLRTPISGKTSYAGLTTVEINDNAYVYHGDTVAVVVTFSKGTKVMYDGSCIGNEKLSLSVTQPMKLGRSYTVDKGGVSALDFNKNRIVNDGRYFRLNLITEDVAVGGTVEHKPGTWEIHGSKKYYYDKNQKTLTGWQNIKGKDGVTRRYFFENDGSVKYGIYTDARNRSYYLSDELSSLSDEETVKLLRVVRAEELLNDKNIDTYDPELYERVIEHGAMKKGEFSVTSEDKSEERNYYSDSVGVLQSGWQRVLDDNGTTKKSDDIYTWKLYGTKENGFYERAKDKAFVSSGAGALKKSEYPYWVLINGGTTEEEYYCFTAYNKLAKGWVTVNRNYNYETIRAKYYFDKISGEMYRGERIVDGNIRYFGEYSGVYSPETSKHKPLREVDGKVYCFNTKGVLQTGWQTVSYRHETRDEETGLISSVTNTYKCYFETDKRLSTYGEMYTGFRTVKGKLYYFSEDDELISESADGMRGRLCTGVINLERVGVSANTISRNGIYYKTAYNPEGTNTYYMQKTGGVAIGYIPQAVNEFGIKNPQKWTMYCNPGNNTGKVCNSGASEFTEITYTDINGSTYTRKYRVGEAIGGFTDGSAKTSFTKWSDFYKADTPYHYDLRTGLRKKTIVYYHGGYYGVGIGKGENLSQIDTIESINRYAHGANALGPGMADDIPELVYATMSEDYPLAASSYLDKESYLNAEFGNGVVIENRTVYNPSCDYVAGNPYSEGGEYIPGYEFGVPSAELSVDFSKIQEKDSTDSTVDCAVIAVKRSPLKRTDYSAKKVIENFDRTVYEIKDVTVEYAPAVNGDGVQIQKRDGLVNVYDVEAYTKAGYKLMCEKIGPENMVLVGTSSGAAIALSLSQWASDENQKAQEAGIVSNLKAPSRLLIVTGWLDAALSSCTKSDIKQSGNGVDYNTLVYWGKRYTNVSTVHYTGEDEEHGATSANPSDGKGHYIVNYPFASPVKGEKEENALRNYVNLNMISVYAATKDPCRRGEYILRNSLRGKSGSKLEVFRSYIDGHGFMFYKNSNNGAKVANEIARKCGYGD